MTVKGSRSERKTETVVSSFYIAFEGSKTEPHYLKRASELKYYDQSKCTFIPKSYMDLRKTSAPRVFYLLKDYQYWIDNGGLRCPWDVFITLLVDNVTERYKKLKKTICKETIKKHGKHTDKRYKEIETISKELYELLKSKKMLIDNIHLDVRQVLPTVKEYMSKRYEGYSFEELIADDFVPPVSFGRNHYVMVVDRDQYTPGNDDIGMIVKNCEKQDYSFIITNPNFEFWVALHYDDYDHDTMIDLIREMIDQQSRPVDERTVTGELGPRKYMRSLDPDYEKNSDFGFVTKEMVDKAIERAKQYPSDTGILKNRLTTDDLSSVGTNMGHLLELLKAGKITEPPSSRELTSS